MTCVTVLLAAALVGLPAGTCMLKCDVGPAIVCVETEDRGRAMGRDGQWTTVHKVDGAWALVLEQEPAMCTRGARSSEQRRAPRDRFSRGNLRCRS